MSSPTSGSYALLPKNMDGEIDDDDDSISKLSHSSVGDHDADRYTGAEDADIESEGISDDEDDGGGLHRQANKNTKPDEKKSMSTARRICFLGSLILCIVVIFVFAFFFPCNTPSCFATKECKTNTANVNKLEYHSVRFPNVLSLSPVKLWDVNEDGTTDLIVGTKSGMTFERNVQCNNTFSDEKCPASVFAVSGKDGTKLWQFNSLDTISFIACNGLDGHSQPECVLKGSESLYYIDVKKKVLIWSLVKSNIQSVLIVSDINDDDTNDVIVAYNEVEKHGWLEIVSGKNGQSIGSSVPLPHSHTATHTMLLHSVENTYHVLVSSNHGNKHFLWGILLQDLFLDATQPGQHSDKQHWGLQSPSTPSKFYDLFESDAPISTLLSDLNLDGIPDLIFCSDDVLELWDGKDLKQTWYQTLDSGHESCSLTVGRYTPDSIPDIFLSLKLLNGSEFFMITDGSNGSRLWAFVGDGATSADPVTISTAEDWNDGFLFWVKYTEKDLKSESNVSKREALNEGKLHHRFAERAIQDRTIHKIFERRQGRHPGSHPKIPLENWSQKRSANQGRIKKRIKMRLEPSSSENEGFAKILDSLPETLYSGAAPAKTARKIHPYPFHHYPVFDDEFRDNYFTVENPKRNYARASLRMLESHIMKRRNSEDPVPIRRRRDIDFREYLPLSRRDYIFGRQFINKHYYTKNSKRIGNSQNWPSSQHLDLNSIMGTTQTRNSRSDIITSPNWYSDFLRRQKTDLASEIVKTPQIKNHATEDFRFAENDLEKQDNWQSYFDSSKFSNKMLPIKNDKITEDVGRKAEVKLDMRKTRNVESVPTPNEKADIQTDLSNDNSTQSCPQSNLHLQGVLIHFGTDGKPVMKLIAQELAVSSGSELGCSLFKPLIQSTPAVENENGKIQLAYAINYYGESIPKNSEESYMIVKKLSLPFKPGRKHSVKRRSTTETTGGVKEMWL